MGIHHCNVDVAHGLVLLFGIGTKALPSWDSRTRRNNLLVGVAVGERRVQADILTHLIHRPARDTLPKGGKSLWMQKLSACIAGGVPFDGIEELEHGRVLYITRDIGASRQEVKKRFMKILPHLGLSEDALDRKLILTDDPFYLNDPASVDNLLAHNPGRFVLVVIDSLFRCVIGSLSQDVVVSAAVDAIDRISRATDAAVVAIHHEPRSGEHLFGSVMLDAAYGAQIWVITSTPHTR